MFKVIPKFEYSQSISFELLTRFIEKRFAELVFIVLLCVWFNHTQSYD